MDVRVHYLAPAHHTAHACMSSLQDVPRLESVYRQSHVTARRKTSFITQSESGEKILSVTNLKRLALPT